jgi:hypothetical protein
MIVRLAMLTHTPVTYWLALPLGELDRWVDTVVAIQREDRRAIEEAR